MYGVAYCRKYIFTSYTIQILCWYFFTTYFEVVVAATLGKSSHSKWYLNEPMASGSLSNMTSLCCHYIYIYVYIVATYRIIKRTELTTVKLPLSFETHNLFNIIGWVGRSLLRYNNYHKYLNCKLGRPMSIWLVNQEDVCRTINRVQEDCIVVSGEYLFGSKYWRVNIWRVNICIVLT